MNVPYSSSCTYGSSYNPSPHSLLITREVCSGTSDAGLQVPKLRFRVQGSRRFGV